MPATLPDLPATPAALERPDVRRPTIDGELAPGQITPGRIASIDILRGFTILLMIFVNDIAGVAGLPGWMKHYQPPDGDGMTFVDVIFPAFLFIVGMSIPFALRRRLAEGGSMGRVWGHILARTAALLIIGVFMVNSDGYADEAALSRPVWTLMMYAGVILVWSHWPRTRHLSPPVRRGMMGAGIILLIASAILFRGPGEPAFIELRPQWWGILGLIGWAYLVGCATYLIVRTNVTAIIGVMVLLFGLYFADGAGALDGIPIITNWISIGSMLGSHGALTVAGLVLGVILLPDSPIRSHAARIRWALTYAGMMAVGAFFLHTLRDVDQMFIVNKIFATPAWCLYSAAITVATWALIYWLIDIRRHDRGTRTLALSGQNALLAYILAPIVYAALALVAAGLSIPNYYWFLGSNPIGGLLRGVALAVFVCIVTAGLRKIGYTLKV